MPSRPIGRAAVLLVIVSMVSAQQILPTSATGTFPTCAVSCAVLIQAQQICQATYSGATRITYENCFCQSPSIQGLYSTPDSVCSGECQVATDRTGLQTWFLTFCNQVSQGIDPNAITSQAVPTVNTIANTVVNTIASTIAGAAPSTTVLTITTTSSPTQAPTITGSGAGQNVASARQQSWIGSHWRWILMLGILIVGLGLLSWLAIWLKRRHRRKIEQQRASISGFPTPSEKRREGVRAATPELWGPHQHMHATKGWQYHAEQAAVIPGDLRDSRRHGRKRSKRERPQSDREPEMAEKLVRPSASRRHSSKGKGKERVDASQSQSESSNRRVSRSRSHRRKERDRDKIQDKDFEAGVRRPSSSPEK